MTRSVEIGLIILAGAAAISMPPPVIREPSAFREHARLAADIQTLDAQVQQLKQTIGFYPVSIPPRKDSWGRDYVYVLPGKTRQEGYDLFSAGPDGVAYTADDDWGE